MNHLPEDLISQWLDRELDPRQCAIVQEHLDQCEACHALKEEMAEVSRVFREAEVVAPPSYLWTRIAAQLDEEERGNQPAPSWRTWLASSVPGIRQPAWLRATVWAPAAVLLIAIGSTIAYMEYVSVMQARVAAISEIDRAHNALLAMNNKTHNPFHESTASDSGINPFAQNTLKAQANPFRTALDSR
jgi:predicted anti-sigma-YlaC factor YlaD